MPKKPGSPNKDSIFNVPDKEDKETQGLRDLFNRSASQIEGRRAQENEKRFGRSSQQKNSGQESGQGQETVPENDEKVRMSQIRRRLGFDISNPPKASENNSDVSLVDMRETLDEQGLVQAAQVVDAGKITEQRYMGPLNSQELDAALAGLELIDDDNPVTGDFGTFRSANVEFVDPEVEQVTANLGGGKDTIEVLRGDTLGETDDTEKEEVTAALGVRKPSGVAVRRGRVSGSQPALGAVKGGDDANTNKRGGGIPTRDLLPAANGDTLSEGDNSTNEVGQKEAQQIKQPNSENDGIPTRELQAARPQREKKDSGISTDELDNALDFKLGPAGGISYGEVSEMSLGINPQEASLGMGPAQEVTLGGISIPEKSLFRRPAEITLQQKPLRILRNDYVYAPRVFGSGDSHQSLEASLAGILESQSLTVSSTQGQKERAFFTKDDLGVLDNLGESKGDEPTQAFIFDIPRNITSDQRRSLGRLNFYEQIMHESPKMEMADGHTFTFDTFRYRQDEMKVYAQPNAKQEEKKRIFQENIRRERIYKERVSQEMIGKEFIVDGKKVRIISSGGGGGFSYGYIAQEFHKVENGQGKIIEEPKPDAKKLFIKFIDVTKAGSQMSEGTRDLLRDLTWKEINTMLNLQKGKNGFKDMPQLKGVMPFKVDGVGRNQEINDKEIRPVNVTITRDGAEVDVPSYFIDFEQDEDGTRMKNFIMPDHVVVAMTFEEDGKDLGKSLHEKIATQQGNRERYDFNIDLQNSLEQLLQEQTNLPPGYKEFVFKELQNLYASEPSFYKKDFKILEVLLHVLNNPTGNEQHRQVIKNEIERIYDVMEKEAAGREEVVDESIDAFIDRLDDIHKHGVVHRDIKLPNILGSGESMKLIDFGLAERKVELLDRETVMKYVHEGFRDVFERFAITHGDPDDWARFGSQLQEYLENSYDNSHGKKSAYDVFSKIHEICKSGGDEFGFGTKIPKETINNFVQQFQVVDPQRFPSAELNKHLVDLFTSYNYLLQGKDTAAAIAIANDIDHSGRDNLLGTPAKTFPPQLFVQSAKYRQWHEHVTSAIKRLQNVENSGQIEAKKVIDKQDLLILHNYYANLRGKGDSFSEIRYEEMQKVLSTQDVAVFNDFELKMAEIEVLKRSFINQYQSIYTMSKFAAMGHEKVDDYAGILTVAEMGAKFKLERKGAPKLVDYSLLEHSPDWMKMIRNVFMSLRRFDGSPYNPPVLGEALSCDALLENDLNSAIEGILNRPGLRDIVAAQRAWQEDNTIKDDVIYNAQLDVLVNHLGKFYGAARSYDKAVTSALVKHQNINSQLEANRGNRALQQQLEQALVAYNQAKQNKETFFQQTIPRFEQNVRADLDRVYQKFTQV